MLHYIIFHYTSMLILIIRYIILYNIISQYIILLRGDDGRQEGRDRGLLRDHRVEAGENDIYIYIYIYILYIFINT